MKLNANVLRAEQATATPNGNGAVNRLPKNAQGSWVAKLLHHRFDFPEWGKFKMTDSGRFSMPYAVLAVMISLLAIVIGACVTVGVAATIGVVSVIKSQTRMETQMETVLRNQGTQESKIDGLKAYAQVETREFDYVKNMLSPGQQERVEKWEAAHPKPDLSKVGQSQN